MGLIYTMLACEEAEIVAVCDIVEEKRIAAVQRVEEVRKTTPMAYCNIDDLLKDTNVEAVVIGSSWDEHIRMAIQSMKAGKITAMEVGGAYDIEECWELVRTYEETKTPIMMMENCCFDRFELLSTSLARAGKLGEIVFAHGAYSHDLRFEMLENNYNYRLGNYLKRNCENYPTHELGPIAKLLDINRGNKMVSLVSVASKAAGLKEAFGTKILKENVYSSLSIDDICSKTNYSKAYLFRIFKAKTGKTIMTYFIELKINQAKQLLRENELSAIFKSIISSIGTCDSYLPLLQLLCLLRLKPINNLLCVKVAN